MAAASLASSSFVGCGVRELAYAPAPAAASPSTGSRTGIIARVGKGTKKVTKKSSSGGDAKRPLWYPGAKSPDYLDGSFVGDYGFDPFGLGKKPTYLQYDVDSLDQNLAKNEPGGFLGERKEDLSAIRATPLQPYAEIFGLQRFRECELIHGRWAMLATLGAIAVETFTGVTWQDAGKVELDQGPSYFGFSLPFTISALVWIEVLVIGYIEFQRNAELDPERRIYPGGSYFDPLGLAKDPERAEVLKLAEIKHARLAMVGAFGFAVQAAATGKGPLDNWVTHLSDPLHTTIIDTFSK